MCTQRIALADIKYKKKRTLQWTNVMAVLFEFVIDAIDDFRPHSEKYN